MASRSANVRAVPLPEVKPLVPLWPDAARPLHIGRARAYEMAQRGTFPVEVTKINGKWKVRTVDLRRFLGLDAQPSV
jgi:hypothetical protein